MKNNDVTERLSSMLHSPPETMQCFDFDSGLAALPHQGFMSMLRSTKSERRIGRKHVGATVLCSLIYIKCSKSECKKCKRNSALREPLSGAFPLKLSSNQFPLFVALPHSFHTSGCRSRMQSLHLFLAEAPVASLPQTVFFFFFYPSILHSSSCLFKSRRWQKTARRHFHSQI